MRLKKYFTLCTAVVVFALLEAFAWEHILAILITAFLCLSAWYISNKKKLELYNQIVANNINLCKKLEASEKDNIKIFSNYTHLATENNSLKEKIKTATQTARIIKEDMIKTASEFGAPFIEVNKNEPKYSLPQSEASKKLGACVHNKTITLEKANYDHE
jgi:hypothetical protein